MALTDAQANTVIREGSTGVIAVTLAEACVKGDAIGYSSGWKRALATVGTAIQMQGVALEKGAIGDVIPVAFGSAIVSGRFTGMTNGLPVYVAEGTSNGAYTETAPSTSGDCNTIIGYAISATEAILMPNARAKTTA